VSLVTKFLGGRRPKQCRRSPCTNRYTLTTGNQIVKMSFFVAMAQAVAAASVLAAFSSLRVEAATMVRLTSRDDCSVTTDS